MEMPRPTGFILGFDPGGVCRFGWSVCSISAGDLLPPLKTGLACDAWDALSKVKEAIGSSDLSRGPKVLAAGIDAPMFWSRKGNRIVDDSLRQALRDTQFPTSKLGGTVQQINSLQGACLVQGVLLGSYLRETWDLQITEAHPKALEHLVCHSGQTEVRKMVKHLTAGLDGHERDATLSAVAAWAMFQELPGWQNLYDQECCPVQPFGTPVGYWMPIPNPS